MPPAINWALPQTRPILMIPGPTELPYPVIQALNQPPTIQYDQSFDEGVLEPTTLALREVFQTRQRGDPPARAPGARRWRPARASVIEPGDPVLVVVAGQFGLLMREIMTRLGAAVTEFPVELGARLDLDRLAREAVRAAPQGHHPRAQRDLHRAPPIPAAEVGLIARRGGSALLPRHRVVHRRPRRAHRRVGRGPQHDGLAEVPGRSAGPRPRLGERPRAWEAMEQRKTKPRHPRLRPAPLEGVVDAGRRAAARCRTAPRAGSPCRSRPISPRPCAWPSASSSTRGCPIASVVTRWPAAALRAGRRPPWASRCSRIPSVAVEHGVLRARRPRGIDPAAVVARDARSLRDPHRHRASPRCARSPCASAPWA